MYMYDPEKLWKAQWKTMMEFQQDMEQNPFGLRFLGPILDTLDFKQLKWCGHGVGPDYSISLLKANT